MKKLVLSIFVCFKILLVSGQTNSFSLEEAIGYALEHSIDVHQQMLNVKSSEIQIKEVRSRGLPQVNFEADYQHFLQLPTSLFPSSFAGGGANSPEYIPVEFGTKNNLTATVAANWLVFDASYLIGLKAAKEYKAYSDQMLEGTKEQLKYNIARAYLSVLIVDQNLAVLDSNLSNVNKLYEDTKAMYKEGFVEKLDVDRLRLSLANIKSSKNSLTSQRTFALNNLKVLMNYPLGESLTLKHDLEYLIDRTEREEEDLVLNHSDKIEVKIMDQSILLNEMNVQSLKAGYLPSLSLYGSYSQGLNGENFTDDYVKWYPTSLIGLKLTVPVFDGFRKKSTVQLAKLEQYRLELNKTALIQSIDVEYNRAMDYYLSAMEDYNAQKDNLSLAQEIYSITNTKYKEGVGSSIELTQAEQELYNTQANYINAIYKALVSKIDLYKALGKI